MFDYYLPVRLIAQTPLEKRDTSRLLVVDKKSQTLTHKHFYNLPDILDPEKDVLVVNRSKTIPARITGKKESGSTVELLFTRESQINAWYALTRPGIKIGQTVRIETPTTCYLLTCTETEGYERLFEIEGLDKPFLSVLHEMGSLPLPHYIRENKPEFAQSYQTIYAKEEGSVATPTAGLHFTPETMNTLREKGVPVYDILLHVGLGTFLPVKTDYIKDHEMHREWFSVSDETAAALNKHKSEGKRIITVGTTTTRVLESCTDEHGHLQAKTGTTNLFIYPSYTFKFADGIITNFHLPKSTLVMLISAFTEQGKQFTTFADSLAGKAYAEAIKESYRFFSFGDAMLLK